MEWLGWDYNTESHENNDLHALIIADNFEEFLRYEYLGKNHDNIANLKAQVFDLTSHGIYGNGEKEADKT